MTIHDTCVQDLEWVYPVGLRRYYVTMLQRNLRRAAHILTVSESSRFQIMNRYHLCPDRISVIYNTIEPEFDHVFVDAAIVTGIRERFAGHRLVFYPGGSEWRKNIGRLVDGFALLVSSGERLRLLVTGIKCSSWDRELSRYGSAIREQVEFLGRLTVAELKAYYTAADAVVYPSLCEGFGRVCLEAMAVGTPVACSDLEVLHEICGDYALYFDPEDPAAIAEILRQAVCAGRLPPRRDGRFLQEAVVLRFTSLMDQLLS